jgi:leucyl-tRNA synthetase
MRDDAAPSTDRYDWRALQDRWFPVWQRLDPFRSGDAADRPRKYVLDMFPYPSGDLHMGHAEAFAIADVIARYYLLRGFDVLHPIGWDSFGLPAENAAIKRKIHPAEWTYANIETQAASFRRYAVSVDWSHRLHTSDPDYYRWTQWLFLRLFEHGLAYRQSSWVNWCPSDRTVLANEQVIKGRCERCGALVTKESLTQWYFRITDYAERLLNDMRGLDEKWPHRVLLMQRNWIGRSDGATISFPIEDHNEPVTVFTTRPETVYGATFLVVAPDSDLARELCASNHRSEFDAYLEQVKQLTDIERQETHRKKTGVFLGRYAINPLSSERLPVWSADYVLADYGTAAIMAVPAHDQRDLEFARAFGLPVRVVVESGDTDPSISGVAANGEGTMVNSGSLDGLSTVDAAERVTDLLENARAGEKTVKYRLRDWLISRQRFWGCPIPMVHCPSCGVIPVPDDELPVILPDLRGDALKAEGVSPLAAATEWAQVACPRCGGPATRDTDTMDTFVDSSWYFLRFVSPNESQRPFDPDAVGKWLPVDQYVGGVEHAILHLLYARFITKVLYDLDYIDFQEPFEALLNQGQVILNGSAMSKSTGNIVDLGQELRRFGVDAIRVTMIFAGPPEDDIDWADVSPAGSAKFLARAWRVCGDAGLARTGEGEGDLAVRKIVARAVHKVTQLIESHRFNVAIARLMELTTALRKAIDTHPGGSDPAVRRGAEALAVMLGLFAPYCAEDCWSRLGHDVESGDTVSRTTWPSVEQSLLVEDNTTCVVQINGKIRERLEVSRSISETALESEVLSSSAVRRHIDGKNIRKIVVRAPTLVSLVVSD